MARKPSAHVEHATNEVTKTTRDDLASLIKDTLNKAQKDGGKVAHFLDEQEDPSMISDWISTGSTLLDLSISNRPGGGLPVGRIVELNGLESCVTEDTKVEINEENPKTIEIREIEELILSGKSAKVKSKGGKFVKVIKYVNKGILDTYEVKLNDNFSIKVSKDHKFFTNAGWVECKYLEIDKHAILCKDEKYRVVKSVNYIGKHKIVDISVDDIDQCYFGNDILNHNTGKSLICAHLCAETQKKGGVAIYLDTESAAAPDFWKALGVKLENLVYVRPFTIEEVFEYVEGIISKVRASNKDRLVTIIVDSIAGATTEKEAESNHGVDGYNTAKALIIGKAMRRITDLISKQRILLVLTNQLRVNMNAMAFGDKYITPGGKGVPFAASVRVRLASLGKLKKDDDVIGVKCKATVVKNRMGPPYRTAEFEIFFDSGIQDRKSWLEFLKKHGQAKSGGGKYTIKLNSGEYKLTAGEFADKLNTDESFKEEIYNTICEKQIMIYRDPSAKIDEDVTESEDDEEVGSED